MTDAEVIEEPLENLLVQVHAIAARVSRTVGRDFSEYIEADDLTQNLMLWAMEHEDKVRQYLTPTDDDPKCKDGRRKMHTTFRRKARGYAHKAKAERLGYEIKDLHFYSIAAIEELLPLALDYDEWMPSQGENTGGGTKQDPALGNDKFALLADVKGAYEDASEEDKVLLWARYIGKPPASLEEMAEDSGVSRTTVGRWVDKALARMLDRLGGSRPDFGQFVGRTVLSNAQAQRLTGSYVD